MTTIVNIFGGPGAGKSTTALGLCHALKKREIEVEYAHEWIKHLVWRGQHPLPRSYYVWAKQQAMIEGLDGNVDIVVTDSPTPLSIVYSREYGQDSKAFDAFVMEKFNALDNLNFYLERSKDYHPLGRLQTEEEAREIDDRVYRVLVEFKIPFKRIQYGSEEFADVVLNLARYLPRVV